MKIYKFSNVLSIPFALILIYCLYLLFKDLETPNVIWALVLLPLLVLVQIYLFQPQIDYWWLSKNPIEVEDNVIKLIIKTGGIYSSLSEEEMKEFQIRLILYVNARSFVAKGMESDTGVPYDVKHMLAQIPISLSLRKDDFLFKDFDRIVIYKHAFPSPGYKFLHTAETHLEDGVILFSLEHAEAAFFNPEEFYNVAWHAYTEAFLKSNGELDLPQVEDQNWDKLEKISGLSRDKVIKTVGYSEFDALCTTIVYYFIYRESFEKHWPTMAKELSNHFV